MKMVEGVGLIFSELEGVLVDLEVVFIKVGIKIEL
jgi:hypothetical protein